MKCERCGVDSHVETHVVDGYRGQLCETCHEQWRRLAQ